MIFRMSDREFSHWRFETVELSAGVYRISDRDTAGRSVEATGNDPDALFTQCRVWAREIGDETPNSRPNRQSTAEE